MISWLFDAIESHEAARPRPNTFLSATNLLVLPAIDKDSFLQEKGGPFGPPLDGVNELENSFYGERTWKFVLRYWHASHVPPLRMASMEQAWICSSV